MLPPRSDQVVVGGLIKFKNKGCSRALAYIDCFNAAKSIRDANSGVAIVLVGRNHKEPDEFGEWLFNIKEEKCDVHLGTGWGFELTSMRSVADLREGSPGELQFSVY